MNNNPGIYSAGAAKQIIHSFKIIHTITHSLIQNLVIQLFKIKTKRCRGELAWRRVVAIDCLHNRSGIHMMYRYLKQIYQQAGV